MELFRGRLVLIDSKPEPANSIVKDGKIFKVIRGLDVPKGYDFCKIVDAGDSVLMPGLVDSHVHVNEPGRTAWEGFATATKAAAAGGVTAIVDMPLNSVPPTTTVENLKTKLRAAETKSFVDVAFWGGVVPDNEADLKPLVEAGVVGFKCFLIHSGVDEFPGVDRVQVMKALNELKDTGSVLLFHAELEEDVDTSGMDPTEYATFLKSRPASMENSAISMVIECCRSSGVRCHIVHLGSGEAVSRIATAQASGVPLTVETCHHYLNLLAENVPAGATQFKCCPPVRTRNHQEALWRAVKEDVISLVVSDHSPCTADLKLLEKGDFMAAWGGISSLQFGLSLFWTAGSRRGFTLADINKYLSVGPAKLAGLDNRKGRIRVGYDADFVIWDPEATVAIETSAIEHKNKVTPYLDWSLKGRVKRTIVRGQTVFEDGVGIVGGKPAGKLILGGELKSEF